LFFQWRQSKAGAEKFHSAFVPHGNPKDSRTWRELSSFGRELKMLADLASQPQTAEVAILLNYESWWALELDSKPSERLQYIEQLTQHYRPLYEANILVDFLHPGDDLTPYKLIIAPTLYLLREAHAKKLNRYVEAGGTLIVSFFSGIVDENEHIHMGGYPAPLRESLGIRVDEFVPLDDEQTIGVEIAGEEYAGSLWSEQISLEGANPRATFMQSFLAGGPAVTENTFGKGRALYIGTQLEPAGLKKIYGEISESLEIRSPLDVPEGIEAVRRGKYLFLMNRTRATIEIHLGARGFKDAVTKNDLEGTLSLNPFNVVVLE
jgi:beta-galactosidase